VGGRRGLSMGGLKHVRSMRRGRVARRKSVLPAPVWRRIERGAAMQSVSHLVIFGTYDNEPTGGEVCQVSEVLSDTCGRFVDGRFWGRHQS
jgi:hypothetical protein